MYDLHNPTRTPRVIYDGIDGSQQPISIPAGATVRNVKLHASVIKHLIQKQMAGLPDVTVVNANGAELAEAPVAPAVPCLSILGMYGIGDNIHQRAIIRDALKSKPVWLQTYYAAMYHDLIPQGLTLSILPRENPRIKELVDKRSIMKIPAPLRRLAPVRLTYTAQTIKRHGSILAAQYASVGMQMPVKPDFSMPVPDEWRQGFKGISQSWKTNGKPIMVYRPIVLNNVWHCPSRSPDPDTYQALFNSIRDRYFVVSIADLSQREWIVGGEQDSDVKFHQGELPFEHLAALFAEANLVFCNPGFAPVLAQAVGTPLICVYGGNETAATTNSVGAHLAPSLFIEPDRPCGCHSPNHQCDKHITLPPALQRIKEFLASTPEKVAPTPAPRTPRVLVFGVTYVKNKDDERLFHHWLKLHSRLNPDCDLLIVDSASPINVTSSAARSGADTSKLTIFTFPDNIGHLTKNGVDGWGRAFCEGLQYAINHDYDYVAHIEGDSLFRMPVMPVIADMRANETKAASIPVMGTKSLEKQWAETGLMFFDTKLLIKTDFINRYWWQNGGPKKYPNTPEKIIFGLVTPQLLPFNGMRDDKDQVTTQNIAAKKLDWITHAKPEIYDRFVSLQDPKTGLLEQTEYNPKAPTGIRVNLGCGTNRIPGWRNHDTDLDITKRLPFKDDEVDFIFIEHCVEHVDYYQAVGFFKEALRVLRPGGVLRVVVPSLEQVIKSGSVPYFKFTQRWQKIGPTAQGAAHAILYEHGHKTAWTASLMECTLLYVGFHTVGQRQVGESGYPELTNVEGHGKVIGAEFNKIESCVFEAMKKP